MSQWRCRTSQGLLQWSVDGLEQGCFSGEEGLEVRKSVFAGVGQPLTQRAEGTVGIGVGECPAGPGERQGDPDGVAVGVCGGEGVVGDGARFVAVSYFW